jgi:hypothetical protein
MKRTIALPLVLGLALGGAALWARARAVTPAAPPPVEAAAPSDSSELERLRAEHQTKNRVIRELTAQGVAKDATLAATVATTAAEKTAAMEKARQSASDAAREVLDGRLEAGAAAADLDRALDGLDASKLGPARIASRRCGGSLCRLELTADSPAAMNTSLEALVERLPKTFGATTVYDTPDGARAVYLARTSDDLAIEPPSEPTAKPL